MAFGDILSQDWYNRLVQGIKEQASGAVRATGSRADDPFWLAKQKQGIADLDAQRQDALRRMWENRSILANNYDAQEAARQRRASWGLANRAQAGEQGAMVQGPDQVEDMAAPDGMTRTPFMDAGGGTSPEAVPSVQLGGNMALGAPGALKGPYTMGAGAVTVRGPAGGAKFGAVPELYNPMALAHPAFDYEKEQKKLMAQNNRLAEMQYQGAQEDLLQKKLKRWPGFGSEALTGAPGKTWV